MDFYGVAREYHEIILDRQMDKHTEGLLELYLKSKSKYSSFPNTYACIILFPS